MTTNKLAEHYAKEAEAKRGAELLYRHLENGYPLRVTFTYPDGQTSTLYCEDGWDAERCITANSDCTIEIALTAYGRAL